MRGIEAHDCAACQDKEDLCQLVETPCRGFPRTTSTHAAMKLRNECGTMDQYSRTLQFTNIQHG